MPELPEAKKNRFVIQYGIPEYDASVLIASQNLANFFEETVTLCQSPKAASNWIMGDLLRDLKEFNLGIEASPVQPKAMAHLIHLSRAGKFLGKWPRTSSKSCSP